LVLEFGVFDHLDASGRPLHLYYEDRLRIIEMFEKAGFRGYYVAEHHATPLGMAPSPNVFLTAVAGRTTSLRFGPLVFALPLYHPFRLAQEICMLDQLSLGRLELGFGRGASPIEAAYFGNDHKEAEGVYRDFLDRILTGLRDDTMDGRGTFGGYPDIPLLVHPYQRPHPPLWYGAHSTESAARAARLGSSIVSLDTAGETREFADSFRDAWAEAHGADSLAGNGNGSAPWSPPLVGLGLFVVVAETDAKALEIARRAYPVWHDSFNWLFRRHGSMPSHQRPPDWDGIVAEGRAVSGSPDTVTALLAERVTESTCNYLVGQHVFGDMTVDETARSIELYGAEVMPKLRAAYP